MKLRKQLLVVSLITLTLPWVGCQYIREMENTLRKGQSEALAATAKAVSARFGSDQTLLKELQRLNPPAGSVPLYAYLQNADPIIDGYNSEWLANRLSMQVLRGPGGAPKAQLAAAIRPEFASQKNAQLQIFIRVRDAQHDYAKPTTSSPLNNDHLILTLHKQGKIARLLLYATGAGDFQTAWLNTENTPEREYQVKGLSSEWRSGYQLEFRLPLEWARSGVGIEIFDSAALPYAAAHNLGLNGEIPPLILPSPLLTEQLRVFERAGVKLQLATRGGHPAAQVGVLLTADSDLLQNRHNFLNWFYRAALGSQTLPKLDSSENTGVLDTPEVNQALQSVASKNTPHPEGRYLLGSQRVLRVASPVFNAHAIHQAEAPVAVIIADQSADGLASLTSSAFYKLLFYSLIATFAASLSLILYASWLSLRIRRLSRAATHAISDSGKIADDFPVFTSRDEIGDLSRNYAVLLARLREYTNYLRSLSSKLSHELRTPLAIVKSSIENLEHEKISAQARIYAERAKEGTNRLSSILNAMSAASRVEQAIGAAELETIPCDELLTNLKDAYEDVYQQASFKLNIRRGDGPLNLRGSGELLVQMLDKLVDNAADFCPADGLIELGLYRHQNTLVFTVHNEGPPLPKHMHGQLFDSMVSVRDKTSSPDNTQHLGLGLYIVRLIADFHRGEVQCYNVPDNSGVIFEIRLPST